MLSCMTFWKKVDVARSNTTIISTPIIEWHVDPRTGTRKKFVQKKSD